MMADPIKEALVAAAGETFVLAMASPRLPLNPVFSAELTLMGETEMNWTRPAPPVVLGRVFKEECLLRPRGRPHHRRQRRGRG